MDKEKLHERLNIEPTVDAIQKFFAEKLKFTSSSDEQEKVIEDLTFEGLTKHWKEKGFKNIITMVGAGISTSAGIPDFRSPGSGLYDNLQKYNLPHPTAIFDMDYFMENPQPFFALAKELYPGTFNPTPSHYFVRLLHDKGLLLRHYTQNIDTLERIAGIPESKLVEAHGTFYTSHCLGCRKEHSMEWMKDQIFADNVPTCSKCNHVVKPDIVFFGENLPEKFYVAPENDFKKCDLLIIMGTSLEVQPFAGLIDRPGPNCMRLLINRDKVGRGGGRSWYSFGPGLMYGQEDNTRDVAYLGDCDEGVYAVADALGWGDELRELVESEHKRLSIENSSEEGASAIESENKYEEASLENDFDEENEISLEKESKKSN
ncbi:NAD-dependent protein deacetylase Sirt2 [Eupeodes corollae]|uniref:NAD-dependent protein deacetylase Sirt2 n=1 Tax=Eupeodes corollae TaxID=290404 RepID=UPI002491C2D1|nr:NAD-dependent protein deacetylase Sirt2 [Eupeodes corollae]